MIPSLYLVLFSVLTYAVWGIDKYKARKGSRRVSERALFALMLLGGAAGAWAGIYVFRHKTQKRKFTVTAPLLTVIEVAIVVAGIWFKIW